MRTKNTGIARAVTAAALVLGLIAVAPASAQAPFGTPQAAANMLIDAIATHDGEAVARLLGKGWADLLPVGNMDPDDVTAFLFKASQVRHVAVAGNRAVLSVGDRPWMLPIPIVQGKDGQWRFDAAGSKAMLADWRIGSNENAAIQAALTYVNAQREYAMIDRNGDGVLEYAQRLTSTPGKRDGLIWSGSLGDESPLGENFAPARRGQSYHGYRFRILKGQGPAARGGERGYLIGNRMTAGFALIAWPAKYGETGVMSFIVNGDGAVFERDLGRNTEQAAAAVQRFSPDAGWKPVQHRR